MRGTKINKIKNKKRAVVTGGCGFIGSHVVKELIKKSYEVIVIDNLSHGKKSNLPEGVIFINADICNYKKIKDLIKEGDIVFHLAALTSVPVSIEKPLAYHVTNISGTYNLLEAARKNKASGVIFSSSAAVYGSQEGVMNEKTPPKPESPYAVQKLIGEELCRSYTSIYGLPTVCLRYFNVYGEGNNEEGSYAPVTARFLKAKREGKPLHITGDGTQTRDFIHVQDVANANIKSISLCKNNFFGIINVCSGTPSRIIDIANIVGGEIKYLPARTEIKHSLGDPSLLYKMIPKNKIIPLAKGIKKYIKIK